MMDRRAQEIAYIVSMKQSMDAWTFREIEILSSDKIHITLFPTKYGSGPYEPKEEWACYQYNPLMVLIRQLKYLILRPRVYLKILIEALHTRTLLDFLLAADFAQQMADRKIDMVHCVFGDHKFFIGYYVRKFLGIPLSVALYGHDLTVNPNWPMFKKAVRTADLIIVNCRYNQRLLSELVGSESGDRAQIVRHFAPLPSQAQPDKVKVLIVGRFEERKGHDVLFHAVRLMGEEAKNIEIWVVGIPGMVDMQRLARKYEVEDQVRIFGSISDQGLQVLYQECDIFCLPSKRDPDGCSEGLPVSLIEAMSYSKPVITTRLAGIPELVEEILVEEDNVKELAQALKILSNDPQLRTTLGARNLDIIKNRYSTQNVSLLQSLFEKTLAGALKDRHSKLQAKDQNKRWEKMVCK
jgi:colanic acid/amylovoran biosynthesis glycosyltransferase